jgi:2-polyprenyl-3-methyl-5-hydroxy-6-metoxy-1,4-benzoquinol methylase
MEKKFVDSCPACNGNDLLPHLRIKDLSISGEYFQVVRCSNCACCVTQDHPPAESIGPYYNSEEYISHSDTKKGLLSTIYHLVRNYMLSSKATTIRRFSKLRKGVLLDYGCGTGYFLNKMKSVGWDVIGIEPDAGARAITLKLFGIKTNPASSLTELKNQSFDVVTLWHVLEHVHDLDNVLHHIARILKPGGKLIIAVPNSFQV